MSGSVVGDVKLTGKQITTLRGSDALCVSRLKCQEDAQVKIYVQICRAADYSRIMLLIKHNGKR